MKADGNLELTADETPVKEGSGMAHSLYLTQSAEVRGSPFDPTSPRATAPLGSPSMRTCWTTAAQMLSARSSQPPQANSYRHLPFISPGLGGTWWHSGPCSPVSFSPSPSSTASPPSSLLGRALGLWIPRCEALLCLPPPQVLPAASLSAPTHAQEGKFQAPHADGGDAEASQPFTHTAFFPCTLDPPLL